MWIKIYALFLSALSLCAFIAYAADKSRAKKRRAADSRKGFARLIPVRRGGGRLRRDVRLPS